MLRMVGSEFGVIRGKPAKFQHWWKNGAISNAGLYEEPCI
jgi:hypothetical protein